MFPLQIIFTPCSNTPIESSIQILYNCDFKVTAPLCGVGGSGVIEAEFLSDRDQNLQGLDFQLVTTNITMEKRFLVHNKGLVGLRLHAQCLSPAYTLLPINAASDIQKNSIAGSLTSRRSLIQDPENFVKKSQINSFVKKITLKETSKHAERQREFQSKSFARKQSRMQLGVAETSVAAKAVECTLEPGQFVLLKVLVMAAKEIIYLGALQLRSEFSEISVPLRAR